LVPLVVAACSSDSKSETKTSNASASASTGSSGSGASTIKITLSDKGCEPKEITAKAGQVTFDVTNDGSAAVTEFEIKKDEKVLGEVENVIPGNERSFTLTLDPGTYVTECPGGSEFDEGTLTVS
jgi:iron uptake system component EfeO